jgi:filamentous hemagglutinin family protein
MKRHPQSDPIASSSARREKIRRERTAGGGRAAVAISAIAAALCAGPRSATAAPSGGSVVSGAATISQSGAVTNIAQSTNKAIINWWSFSIAAGETVNFNQPSALSVTLNRVVGNEASVIAGALNANGRVFLVNSNGILFSKGSQVNVGGLVASTLNISDADFLAGNHVFSGSSTASVVNQGRIRASEGGYVALLGKTVANEGTIVAKLGSIALASGEKITLSLGPDQPFDVSVDAGAINALVENKGAIKADGGTIILTAKAKDALLSAQVNNTGLVRARTIADLTGGSSASSASVHVGRIKLLAAGGTVKVAGKLDASAKKRGDGGSIETSGNQVIVASDAVITTKSANGKAGSWLIDPDGFTIAASGGDITGATLSAQLENTNVTIASTAGSGTSGDIDVNDVVSWAANSTLTLNATNNININKPIYATGDSAGVVLNFGGYAATGSVAANTDYTFGAQGSLTLTGANSSLSVNGQSYTLIHSLAQLTGLSVFYTDANGNFTNTVASGKYALAQNLNASGVIDTLPLIVELSGTLAGLGHTISNVTLNLQENTGTYKGSAPFDTIDSSGVIRDLGLANIAVSYLSASANTAGAAAGFTWLNQGTISNVFVTGSVSANAGTVDGLAGQNSGLIINAYTNLALTGVGGSDSAGLVGTNTRTGVIKNSTANGTLTVSAIDLHDGGGIVQADYVGGLVGTNSGGTISNSQANVDITTTNVSDVGGFVGQNIFGGTITNSSATGSVTALNNIGGTGNQFVNYGGFAGFNEDDEGRGASTISNSSSSGAVTVTSQSGIKHLLTTGIGGFVGANAGVIDNSVTTSNVRAVGDSANTVDAIGGFSGQNGFGGTISNSSSNGTVTGTGDPNGSVGAFNGFDSNGNYVNNTYNTTNGGGLLPIGDGTDPGGGINGATTAPGAPTPANPGSDFGAASSVAQSSAARGLTQAAASRAASQAFSAALASAARQSAAQSGNSSSANVVSNPPIGTTSPPKAGVNAARSSDPGFDENVKIDAVVLRTPSPPRDRTPHVEDDTPHRRPRVAVAPANSKPHAPVHRAPAFGASIRGVDVNGKRYNLQDDTRSNPNAPATTPVPTAPVQPGR